MDATISTRSLTRRMRTSRIVLLTFLSCLTCCAESSTLPSGFVLHPLADLVTLSDMAGLEKVLCARFFPVKGAPQDYHAEHARCGLPFDNLTATVDIRSGRPLRVSLVIDKSYCLSKESFERRFPGGHYTLGSDWARQIYAIDTNSARLVSTYDDQMDRYGCMLDVTAIFKIPTK